MSAPLADRHCVVCKPGTPTLPREADDTLLGQLSGWEVIDTGDHLELTRTFRFKGFLPGGENRSNHPLLRVFHKFFTAFPLFCRRILDTVVGGLMHFFICWALHQKEREVLLGGILPWGIDAVVFCWRCDRMRGRAVRVLQMTPQGLHACSAHSAH